MPIVQEVVSAVCQNATNTLVVITGSKTNLRLIPSFNHSKLLNEYIVLIRNSDFTSILPINLFLNKEDRTTVDSKMQDEAPEKSSGA